MLKYSENIVPKMNSNNFGDITISGSSSFGDIEQYSAWKAFNRTLCNSDYNSWATASYIKSGWVKIDFGIGKRVCKYTIQCRSFMNDEQPKDWTFEGSNDDKNWTILDRITNQINWKSREKREYVFDNHNVFRYYKLNISGNNGQDWMCIDEIELMEIIDYYLINNNNFYYSLDTRFYINGNYMSIPVSDNIPNKLDLENAGFNDINMLCKEITIGDETFKPIDKFNGNFNIFRCK